MTVTTEVRRVKRPEPHPAPPAGSVWAGPLAWQRALVAATLGVAADILVAARRGWSDRLDREELRLRAWRVAIDPETDRWLAEARASVADGSALRSVVTRDDFLRRIEEERRSVQP